MARPPALNPQLLARVRASHLQPTALLAELEREGVKVSLRTIQRARNARTGPAGAVRGRAHADMLATLRARQAPPATAPEPALDDAAPTSLEAELAALRRRKAKLEVLLEGWAESAVVSPQAVLSHGRLLGQLAQVTSAIVELTPRPVEDQYAPIEAAALESLLRRAVAAADADETAGLRDQVASLRRTISTLADRLAEGD